jgi:hypothetical protein
VPALLQNVIGVGNIVRFDNDLHLLLDQIDPCSYRLSAIPSASVEPGKD